MMNFRESAINTTTLSDLMVDREKISTEDIMTTYPGGITVYDFDTVPAKDGTIYYIGVFREDDTKFFNGGTVFTRICDSWTHEVGGDMGTARNELKEYGGVKFKFEKRPTKDKTKTVTALTVV